MECLLPNGNEDELLSWLDGVVTKYKSLSSHNRNVVLDTLIASSEPQQLSFLSTLLPDLLYRDFISHLPQEVVIVILKYLDGKQILKCCQVSKSWKKQIDSLITLWHLKVLELGVDISSILNDSPLEYQNDSGVCSTLKLKSNKRAVVYKAIYCQAEEFLSGLRKVDQSLKLLNDHITTGERIIIHFCHNDQHIFTGHRFCVDMWSISNGTWEKSINISTPENLLFCDDTYLYTSSYNCIMECWNIKSGAKVHTFVGHTGFVVSADVLTDRSYVLTGSTDHSVKVWDLRSGTRPEIVITLENAHTDFVRQVYFLPCGEDERLRFVSCDVKGFFSWCLDIPTRHVQSSHVRLADEGLEMASNFFDPAQPDSIFISQWNFKAKTSWLAHYHLCTDTSIRLDKRWQITERGLKACLLGVGSRFALFYCSISCQDFHLFDMATGSILVTIATPVFSYTLFKDGPIQLCDTSWLNGLVLDKMHHGKPVFVMCDSWNSIMVGRWNIPKVKCHE